MRRVRVRIYGEDDEGNKVLVHKPGDWISDEEAERLDIDALAPPRRPMRGWTWRELADGTIVFGDEEPEPAPKLDRMKLADLQALCAAEDIDPGDANLRAEYIAVIEAARADNP